MDFKYELIPFHMCDKFNHVSSSRRWPGTWEALSRNVITGSTASLNWKLSSLRAKRDPAARQLMRSLKGWVTKCRFVLECLVNRVCTTLLSLCRFGCPMVTNFHHFHPISMSSAAPIPLHSLLSLITASHFTVFNSTPKSPTQSVVKKLSDALF